MDAGRKNMSVDQGYAIFMMIINLIGIIAILSAVLSAVLFEG
ncbi:hypothetical protein ACQCWI_28180 [Bacillus thuringiensis]